MELETAINHFVDELIKLGLDNSGALLLQIQIKGKSLIRSYGNLNNLVTCTAIEEKGRGLIHFMEQEIAQANIRESTRKLHYDTLNQLKDFTEEITIQSITADFIEHFDSYLRQHKLSINTIARHMKTLKRYTNVARKKGIITHYPFLNYTIKSEQTHRDALSEKELGTLESYQDSLEKPNEALNAFLFSCYTGLRYSDICLLSKKDIYTINRKKWIVIKMYKTSKEVRIPISIIFDGKALSLTKSIPRQRGKLFHLQSNQQTNRELKRIAKQVGIKNITFHTARHTCATLLLYRGVSLTTVQKILGHQSVKTTQIYSAVTDLTLERELKKSNARRKGKVGKK